MVTEASRLPCHRSPLEVSHASLLAAEQPDGEPVHRVALFSGNYNCVFDGANRALNRLAAHLLKRGHAVRIYSPTVRNPAFSPAGDLVSVPSWPIPFRQEYRFAPRLPSVIGEDVHRFRPTLVHVSAPDGLGAAAIRLARAADLPVVASIHTRFDAYLSYYGLGSLRWAAEAWLRRFYRKCDAVLVPSDAIAKDLSEIGIEATHVWNSGVDQAEFSPALRDMTWRRGLGFEDQDIVLLFFGRLVAEKGLAAFAAAAAMLRAERTPIRLLIVGDGPERQWLARRLPEAVFTGHLAGIPLGRAVASADILLNPSLTETFGSVTLEAMASGVAVVAADVSPNRFLIENGRTGLLVPAEPIAGYAAAIGRLAADRSARRAMSKAAMKRACWFGWTQTLDRVLEAYSSVRR